MNLHAPRLPLTRELSAKLTEGEKTLDFRIAFRKRKPSGLLSLRQNLRFCHLPRQREALGAHKYKKVQSEISDCTF